MSGSRTSGLHQPHAVLYPVGPVPTPRIARRRLIYLTGRPVSIFRFVLSDRGDRRFCDSQKVIRGKQDLQAPRPRRDRDDVPELGRLVEVDRVALLAGQCRHAAADVAGERFDILERDGVDLLVTGRPGECFQLVFIDSLELVRPTASAWGASQSAGSFGAILRSIAAMPRSGILTGSRSAGNCGTRQRLPDCWG
jgi:hypothetical protein